MELLRDLVIFMFLCVENISRRVSWKKRVEKEE